MPVLRFGNQIEIGKCAVLSSRFILPSLIITTGIWPQSDNAHGILHLFDLPSVTTIELPQLVNVSIWLERMNSLSVINTKKLDRVWYGYLDSVFQRSLISIYS